MSDAVQIAIVASIAPTITAIISGCLQLRKLEVIHKATNSMNDELVKTTDKESFARGVKSETDKSKL